MYCANCFCFAEFRDFVPQFTQRTVHNQGYETYDEIWKRASRWIHITEPDAILNIQSVFVKFKKGTRSKQYPEHSTFKFWCIFCSPACITCYRIDVGLLHCLLQMLRRRRRVRVWCTKNTAALTARCTPTPPSTCKSSASFTAAVAPEVRRHRGHVTAAKMYDLPSRCSVPIVCLVPEASRRKMTWPKRVTKI